MFPYQNRDLDLQTRLHDGHYIAQTPEEAMALGLEASADLQLYFSHDQWHNGLIFLVESGRISESAIDRACGNVLRVKFMMGLFDQPYTDEDRSGKVMHCQAYVELAREISRKSICLLENDNDLGGETFPVAVWVNLRYNLCKTQR